MAIRSWTSSQHQEFKEAFAYFDDDHDGKISGEQAATLIQALGMSPTVAELHAAKIQPKSSLTFAKFMSIMSSHFTQRKKNAGAGILAAFKYFNAFANGYPSRIVDGELYTEDNDEVKLADLEHIMTQMGDRLDTTEWANLRAKASEFVVPGTDSVNYRRLIMAIV